MITPTKDGVVLEEIKDIGERVREEREFALAQTKPWQREMKAGDHYGYVEGNLGVWIFGTVVDSEYEEDRESMKAMPELRLVEAGSVHCPETEMGTEYICNFQYKVANELFDKLRQQGWTPAPKDVDEMAVAMRDVK